MKDPAIIELVESLKQKVSEINDIMAALHEQRVEVRLQYKLEENPEKKPTLSIWRCTGHDDYLQ